MGIKNPYDGFLFWILRFTSDITGLSLRFLLSLDQGPPKRPETLIIEEKREPSSGYYEILRFVISPPCIWCIWVENGSEWPNNGPLRNSSRKPFQSSLPCPKGRLTTGGGGSRPYFFFRVPKKTPPKNLSSTYFFVKYA